METATKKQGIVYTQPSEGFWDVPGVLYRGKTGTYRLFEQMTSAMNQEQLAELYETEKQKGNPHPTDAPLILAIASVAHSSRDENPQDTERLRQFLRTSFRKYPNTLTRIAYEPSGKDKIIHNYKTSDEYSIEESVVGPDGLMNEISNKKVLESLLGTSNVTQINAVSQWINGTDSYIWRLNSKPSKKDERVARFDAAGGRFGLFCLRFSRDGCPAFRVLKVD
jgi:hypothetical protein